MATASIKTGLHDTGIEPPALERYVEAQVYSLLGTDRHRDVFSIVLTGSRATGEYRPDSDVDVDVLCPQSVYDRVHAASREAGIIDSPRSFFRVLKGDTWSQYFGEAFGRPHFSLIPLERVSREIASCRDVPLWIWTKARILTDPGDQFRSIVETFDGYPPDVLYKKIKYRWMMSAYATGILNAANELLRFFFLVEGEPFPYAGKLMTYARDTNLGRRFCPLLERIIGLVVGTDEQTLPTWERLDRAFEMFCCGDKSHEAAELQDAGAQAMIDAGVDPQWVKADFQNLEELLSGELGPPP